MPTFDAARTMAYLRAQCDFGPRNPGSVGAAKCLAWLCDTLTKMGARVERQPFEWDGYDGARLSLCNVIAHFGPTTGAPALLMAHWDTRPWADQERSIALRAKPILGANDGASGVAVLLELAEMMSRTPPHVPVDLVFFDGEDYGHENDLARYFLGARYYASQLPTGFRPRVAILVDMIADRQPTFPVEGYSLDQSRHTVDLVYNLAVDSLKLSAFSRSPKYHVEDDHIPLLQAGVPAIDLIDMDYPEWHTLADVPAACSPEGPRQVGTLLAHLLWTDCLLTFQP